MLIQAWRAVGSFERVVDKALTAYALDFPTEAAPELDGNEILSLGERRLAELAETQRPHVAKASPLRLVRARRAWWWLRREFARVGIVVQHVRRAARSPRTALGRRFAWLRLVAWRMLLDPRILVGAVTIALFAISVLQRLEVIDVAKTFAKKETLDAGTDIVAAVSGLSAAGAIALLWSEFVRYPLQAWRIRRRIRRRPASILPTAPTERELDSRMRDDPLEGMLIPRADVYDEVLPGVTRKRRRDVQIIVGEPGSGKTTALVGIAKLLARLGMVPVLVPLRGESVNVFEAAREAFEKQMAVQMRSTSDTTPLWRWLRARERVVVLIDDVDQIAPDGEKGFVLRSTLSNLASRDFAVIATARPAGIPAGVAASSIELGALDEDSVVDYICKEVQQAPGGPPRAVSERELRSWVKEGKLAEVPFYVELLACLSAAGKCRELASAEVLHDEGEWSGRFRQRADGTWEWNHEWVRFTLLTLFYDWLGEGSVRRWLGMERRERESALELLENAALGSLLAKSREAAQRAAAKVQAPGGDTDAESWKPARAKLDEFIDAGDRDDELSDGLRTRVSAHEAVDAGEQLRLLDRDHRHELQFRHRIMQAFMASRRLIREQGDAELLTERVDLLLDRHNPEKLTAHMALAFAVMCAQDRVRRHIAGAAHGRAATNEQIAERTRTVAVERLIASAKDALAHDKHPAIRVNGSKRDPLSSDTAPDPENRKNPDDALINLTTAANILSALRKEENVDVRTDDGAAPWFRQRESDIVRIVKGTDGATRWTKLGAIAGIARLDDDERWKRLWEYARDRDYKVRRAASLELQMRAEQAYRALAGQIDALIVRAAARSALSLPIVTRTPSAGPAAHNGRDGRQWTGDKIELRPITPWEEEDVLDLTALGWVLPAIVSGLREDPGHQRTFGRKEREDAEQRHTARVHSARGALEALVTLAFEGGHHKLEASLAQGFKDDAMRHASADSQASGPGWVASNRRLVAEICLDHAEFWHTRLLLYQALALYSVAGANRREAHEIFARFLHPSRERHPFARRTATLSRRALERKQVGSELWSGLIWADEGQVVGRQATMLDDRAAQLVGDVTLLLNLNEQSVEDRQVQFGQMHDLPHCLSISKDRGEILGNGCANDCGWGLCPYVQPPPDEPNAYRGVSRAFCRQQQQIARRSRRPRWQHAIHRGALERFWRQMERRARV